MSEFRRGVRCGIVPHWRPTCRRNSRMPAALARIIPALAIAAALVITQRAHAQTSPTEKPEMMENCPGLIASDQPRLMPASLRLALKPDEVRISYAGHSTFLIESPQGARIATDYNDYVRPPG